MYLPDTTSGPTTRSDLKTISPVVDCFQVWPRIGAEVVHGRHMHRSIF